MRRVIIAPDSFKESLSAPEVAAAIAKGIQRAFPEVETVAVPMADGGEGLTETLVAATGGSLKKARVTGPLGTPVEACWGILGDGHTAVVEMAQASGLPLVPRDKRNPLVTTTYGTGELIREALEAGCRRLVVGIGGSATNDGGAGMAQALGVKLLDSDGKAIPHGATGLEQLDRIDISALDHRLKEVEIQVACDVDNPLCGPRGASAVYGPQKGATPEMVSRLDEALAHLAAIIERDLGKDIREIPGAGAAGGLGAGLMAFLDANLRRGIDLVIETLDLEKIMASGADLVITGEGEINYQTAYGKVPIGVARVAAKYNLPVVALVGSIGERANAVFDHGINGIMSIVPRPVTLSYCLENAAELLADAAERLVRLITVGSKMS
ncbi:MAG: glycerate kinase [Clostridia bacterium]|nr:glycerate kinase [Clostridia bacterium]